MLAKWRGVVELCGGGGYSCVVLITHCWISIVEVICLINGYQTCLGSVSLDQFRISNSKSVLLS